MTAWAAVTPLTAHKSPLPVYVYGGGASQHSPYVASGYMGDSSSVKIKAVQDDGPSGSRLTGQPSLQIAYAARGGNGWAGVYWLTPANNWGRVKGAGYDLTQATKLTFWARGESGGERLSEVKVGGIVGPYPDTDAASIGPIVLNALWRQYTIDLKGKDLRHMIGGFAFMIRRADNPRGAVFYLDDIRFEGEESAVTPQ